MNPGENKHVLRHYVSSHGLLSCPNCLSYRPPLSAGLASPDHSGHFRYRVLCALGLVRREWAPVNICSPSPAYHNRAPGGSMAAAILPQGHSGKSGSPKQVGLFTETWTLGCTLRPQVRTSQNQVSWILHTGLPSHSPAECHQTIKKSSLEWITPMKVPHCVEFKNNQWAGRNHSCASVKRTSSKVPHTLSDNTLRLKVKTVHLLFILMSSICAVRTGVNLNIDFRADRVNDFREFFFFFCVCAQRYCVSGMISRHPSLWSLFFPSLPSLQIHFCSSRRWSLLKDDCSDKAGSTGR